MSYFPFRSLSIKGGGFRIRATAAPLPAGSAPVVGDSAHRSWVRRPHATSAVLRAPRSPLDLGKTVASACLPGLTQYAAAEDFYFMAYWRELSRSPLRIA